MLALVLSVAVARAQGSAVLGKGARACPSFEECYRLAIRLYKAEQVPEALAAFEAAYGFNPEPNLLINIGRAHFRLGHYREALDYYQRFQSKSPGADESVRTRVEQYIAEAKKALDSAAPSPAPNPAPGPAPGPAAVVSPVSPSVSSVSPPVSPAAPPRTDGAERPGEPSTTTPPATGAAGATGVAEGAAASRAAVAAAPSTAAPADAGPRAEGRPLYKKWWFWGVLGLVVAGGVTAGVVLGTQQTAADLSGIEVRKLRF
ncbi:MAG: tetratricopeptide repeat protein [Polyangia bacterium]